MWRKGRKGESEESFVYFEHPIQNLSKGEILLEQIQVEGELSLTHQLEIATKVPLAQFPIKLQAQLLALIGKTTRWKLEDGNSC